MVSAEVAGQDAPLVLDRGQTNAHHAVTIWSPLMATVVAIADFILIAPMLLARPAIQAAAHVGDQDPHAAILAITMLSIAMEHVPVILDTGEMPTLVLNATSPV